MWAAVALFTLKRQCYINIIGLSNRSDSLAFPSPAKKQRMLVLWWTRTRQSTFTYKDSPSIENYVTVGRYKYEKEIYLGTSINTTNNLRPETKCKIVFVNSCYFDIGGQLRSRSLSRWTKITLFKCLMISILLNGSEAWTMMNRDEKALEANYSSQGLWSRSSEWWTPKNHELYE